MYFIQAENFPITSKGALKTGFEDTTATFLDFWGNLDISALVFANVEAKCLHIWKSDLEVGLESGPLFERNSSKSLLKTWSLLYYKK